MQTTNILRAQPQITSCWCIGLCYHFSCRCGSASGTNSPLARCFCSVVRFLKEDSAYKSGSTAPTATVSCPATLNPSSYHGQLIWQGVSSVAYSLKARRITRDTSSPSSKRVVVATAAACDSDVVVAGALSPFKKQQHAAASVDLVYMAGCAQQPLQQPIISSTGANVKSKGTGDLPGEVKHQSTLTIFQDLRANSIDTTPKSDVTSRKADEVALEGSHCLIPGGKMPSRQVCTNSSVADCSKSPTCSMPAITVSVPSEDRKSPQMPADIPASSKEAVLTRQYSPRSLVAEQPGSGLPQQPGTCLPFYDGLWSQLYDFDDLLRKCKEIK